MKVVNQTTGDDLDPNMVQTAYVLRLLNNYTHSHLLALATVKFLLH